MAKKSQPSGKSLVIVESPAKAKTINRYLGDGYKVVASFGHVRDLPAHDLGIDFENNFEPVYEVLAAKRKVVNSLKKLAKNAPTVYLATDLDREGEAIAWHLVSALELEHQATERVVFNEITKSAIQDAFAHPHQLDMAKVNAQQARRLLDRIVGYQLSPLLQSKIGKGLSAGRVQSVAVRLIVDREREIRAFIPKEHWRLHGCFTTDLAKLEKLSGAWTKLLAKSEKTKSGLTVKARNKWLSEHECLYAELASLNGKPFKPTNVNQAKEVAEHLGLVVNQVEESEWEEYAKLGLKRTSIIGSTMAGKAPSFEISEIQKRRTKTKPNGPFTTASLQQAASSELGFSPSRTMRVAQQLYEGIDFGGSEGPVGLITYMRTDSYNLSKDSVSAARNLISNDFGDKHLPAKPNVYGSRKRAQEAHEAVRPSDVTMRPADIMAHLSAEQTKLYGLIWRRFVACQMTPAEWDSTTVLIKAPTPQGEAIFRTTGRRLVFDGFLRVMGQPDTDDVVLPALKEKQELGLLQLKPEQHYTTPPARYGEASLVKKMEAEGIGRPSTYAAIIQTIQDRQYVELIDKKLHPSPIGEVVTDSLIEHFPKVMDFKFTSFMEEELDKVEESSVEWQHVLGEFYTPFKAALESAGANMQRARSQPSEFICPECGREMVYRIGKKGRFLSCSGYPKCKVAMNIDADGQPVADVVAEEPCPKCGKELILRKSRIGPFLGCTGYPECSHTQPSDENGIPLKKVSAEDIKETCPDCKSEMTVKFSRGRSFLGCSAYPKCKATQPLPEGVYVEKPKPAEAGARCDKCGRNMVIRTGRRGPFLSCSGFPRCRNAMPMEKIDHLRALEEAGEIPEAPPDNGKTGSAKADVPRDKNGKVDIAAMGPPPPGFAWTRTGRPVVETWPQDTLECPECGGEVDMKTGRFGPYYGCTRFPKCRFVSNLRGAAKKRAEIEFPTAAKPKPIPTDIPCDECGAHMVIRTGRSGEFLGCSKYPKCKNSQPMPEGQSAKTLAVAEK